MSPFRKAHGNAKKHGAMIVAEQSPLDEVPPLNPDDTARGLALTTLRGRPFQKGNRAAANRGPSLTRITVDPDAPEERRRVLRKAQTLKQRRMRELAIEHGAIDWALSSAVQVELVSWARCAAWADFYDRAGDAIRAAALSEKASAHQLKAVGHAAREAAAHAKARGPVDYRRLLALDADEGSDDGKP